MGASLGEEAFVNLNRQLLDDPTSGIGLEQLRGWSLTESGVRPAKPCERAFPGIVYRFRLGKSGEPALNDLEQLLLGLRWSNANPFADLLVNCGHGSRIHYATNVSANCRR